MGDSGSLALGGMLAIIAIVGRQELLLVVIGGAFVLEGLSALISARILVKFYRRFLFVERFGSSRGFPHTEFPLPFLATPMHHHYDLLNIDRKRLVYGAWLLGAGLGILGIATAVGPFTWERYLGRLAALVVLIAVWQAGPWTKAFFIGLEPSSASQPSAPRRLFLYHGAPFRLFGKPMYRRVDMSQITDRALQDPAEQLVLWQRLSVFDARALLGYFCFREGDLEDAIRIWDRLPDANIDARPNIKALIQEATHAVALQKGSTRAQAQSANDGAAADNPANSGWRRTAPPAGMNPSPRLQPMGGQTQPVTPQQAPESRLWQANRWAEASGMSAARDPNRTYPPAPSVPLPDPGVHETLSDVAPRPPKGDAADGDREDDALLAHTSAPGVQRPSETGDL